MRSATMSDETLSRSRPPYCSGTLMPSSPSSPHAADQRPRELPVLGLRALEIRQHLGVDELVGRLRHQPVLVGQLLGCEDVGRALGVLEQPRAALVEPRLSSRVLPVSIKDSPYIRSKMPAAPMPPPTHIVTIP